MTEQYYDKRGIRVGTLDVSHCLWLAIPGRNDQCQETPEARVELNLLDWELMVFNAIGHQWRNMTYSTPEWRRAVYHLSRELKNIISHQSAR